MNFKKVLAVFLAVMAILTLSLNVFAEDDNTFSISKATGDTHNYKIYQIATGDVYEGKLSNAYWGDGVTDKTGEISLADAQALEAVANTNDTDEVNGILNIIGSLNEANAKEPGEGFVPGYYLVKDADAASGANDYPLYMIAVLGADATIERKAAEATPTANKVIVTASGDKKGVTADAGDVVYYKVTATLPSNLSMYKTYAYSLVDTLSEKLTYNGDMKVMQGSNNITDVFTVTYTNGKITASSSDIKVKTGDTTTDLVFTYSVTLAADANAENSNKVNLTYSNNPNGEGTGTSVDDPTVTPDSPTSTVATVYTSTLIIESDPEGGEFELTDKDGNVIDPVSPNKWTGLDDGEYTLTEKTTPNGYNTPKPITFEIKSTIDDEGKRTDITADGIDNPTIDVPNGTITATITHQAGASLPVTGTIGILALAGAAAVVTGTAFGFRMKGKKENEEEAK